MARSLWLIERWLVVWNRGFIERDIGVVAFAITVETHLPCWQIGDHINILGKLWKMEGGATEERYVLVGNGIISSHSGVK